MWITHVQNNCAMPITANGTAIAPGQSLDVDYVWTGVSVQVPGIGQIQALEAGDENPGPHAWAVKLVTGVWSAYWGYDGTPTMTLTVYASGGKYYFSVTGGPTQIQIQQAQVDIAAATLRFQIATQERDNHQTQLDRLQAHRK